MHGNANHNNGFSLLRSTFVYVYFKCPYKSLSLLATLSACPEKKRNTFFSILKYAYTIAIICSILLQNYLFHGGVLFQQNKILYLWLLNVAKTSKLMSEMKILKEPFSFLISSVVIKLIYKAHRWDQCASTLKIAEVMNCSFIIK